MNRVQHNRGFTLFELLVAISVFAVVSAMAYSGLMQIMDARAHTSRVESRLAELQMAFLHLGRDIEHTVNRPIRSEFGDVVLALKGGELGDYRLEFTRTGHRNPARVARSLLQRVAYVIDDNKLYRVIWPVLDRAQNTEPKRMIVLEQTESIEFRFLEKGGEWQTSWPIAGDEQGLKGLPRAVAVKVKLTDIGEIDRIFLLPEA